MAIKFARRCAYDLDHAAGMAPGEFRDLFCKRAQQWIALFDPDRMKQYRVSILDQLEEIERENEVLRKQLREAGILPDSEKPF